jgi:LysM repeat protein
MKHIGYIVLLTIFMSWIGCKSPAQEEKTYFFHTVQTGQSLYSISTMYHVTIDQIVNMNPGSEKMIFSGERLRIPQESNQDSTTFHTIKMGETLYRISQMYKISIQAICDYNPGLTAENFKAGEVIRIPRKENVVSQIATTPKKVESTPPRYQEIHLVKKRETVYSICKKFHITEQELADTNPCIQNGGIKKGDTLYIPYPTPPTRTTPPTDHEVFNRLRATVKPIGSIHTAVLLPFSSDERMVEYYEGLLLAVDSMKRAGVSMDIYAFDTKEGINNLIKEKKELANMDLIIGPADKEDIKPLGDFAKAHKIRLVIPFTSKDNEVFNNPYIYQVNTSQIFLYSAVYEHFLYQFNHPNVIFIETNTNDKSKSEFINGFKSALTRNGIHFSTISDAASVEDWEKEMFPNRGNIFVPTSGSDISLIKILPKLQLLIRTTHSTTIRLFGYPEWQTMTKEHLKQFFEVNTYFYSLFYTNHLLPEAKAFEKNYRNWYHKVMANSYPKYGMLGYDTALFFLKGLSTYGSAFDANIGKLKPTPVQTGFYFKRVNNWGGFINQKVFFVHYSPQSEVTKIDFD